MDVLALPILFLDAQTTGTNAKTGSVIELGWCVANAVSDVENQQIEASLLSLPEGQSLSVSSQRITGITPEELEAAPQADSVWRRFFSELPQRPMPTLIHYARFETPFLLERSTPLPLDIQCTYQIAKRLIPDLPSSTIRAVSGFFGCPTTEARRAADHVRATLWIWRHLAVKLKEEAGITSWEALRDWLGKKPERPKGKKGPRLYALPREKRLALPPGPGIYRMLGSNGKILYVGKATCLKDRVNSYFRTRIATRGSRISELMAQVHDIEVSQAETTVEAALMEADEIKRCDPPYNASLRVRETKVSFWSADLIDCSDSPDEDHLQGPFASRNTLERLRAIQTMLVSGGGDPDGIFPEIMDETVSREGIRLFNEKHGIRSVPTLPQLLNLGGRLPKKEEEEGTENDEDEEDLPWTCEDVVRFLESCLRHTSRLAHRSRWMCRLTEASIRWRPQPQGPFRVLLLENGQIAERETVKSKKVPVPRQWKKNRLERLAGFDRVVHDRLAVLLSELRRLTLEKKELAIRLSPKIQLTESDLERWL